MTKKFLLSFVLLPLVTLTLGQSSYAWDVGDLNITGFGDVGFPDGFGEWDFGDLSDGYLEVYTCDDVPQLNRSEVLWRYDGDRKIVVVLNDDDGEEIKINGDVRLLEGFQEVWSLVYEYNNQVNVIIGIGEKTALYVERESIESLNSKKVELSETKKISCKTVYSQLNDR